MVGATVAVGVGRRWTGLAVGVGGAIVIPAVLWLSHVNVALGFAAAAGAGVGLGWLGRETNGIGRGGPWWHGALGGLGGATFGVALVLAIVTSLPIQRQGDQVFYPPRDLPPPLTSAGSSWTVAIGRDILLYPLLDAQGAVPSAVRPVYRALHAWFVVGEPWNETGGGGS